MTGRKWLMAAVGVGAALAAREVLRRRHEITFRGKTVLITGGSRGLGLALARRLLNEGARVAVCARHEADLGRARQLLTECCGGTVFTVRCDITDPEQVRDMVNAVWNHLGAIDVLINNAGTIEVGPIEVQTVADYEEAMKTHFWGPLYCTLAVLPEMRFQGFGRIVNISSIGGKVSVPHLVPYCASKFALVGLSEGMRAELAKDGVLVTTVCPGLMRTGSPRNAWFKGQHRAEYAWFSISDALPVFSISAERAARSILRACRRGDAEVILSLPAKAAVWFHGLFPGLTADLLGLTNRLLPRAGGIGTARARGSESQSSVSPSALTALDEKAAREYNQVR